MNEHFTKITKNRLVRKFAEGVATIGVAILTYFALKMIFG